MKKNMFIHLEIFAGGGGSLPPDLLEGGERGPNNKIIQTVTVEVNTS